jgi:RNA polymerase sigma factor (sigma-70 family)
MGYRTPAKQAMTTQDWLKQVARWADEWHADLLKFLERRTRTPADAEDLAQEVYLRLLRVERTDLIRQPRSYLLRIAANALDDWRLKAQQARPHEAAALEVLQAPDNPEQAVIADQRERRLAAELSQLPAAVRAALVLQIRDGMSYDEIATKMNVTPRMIKRYLLAAYAALRAQLPSDL